MKSIYVVIKGARDPAGETMFITTEKAFNDPVEAQKFIASLGPSIWEENIQGFNCYCERVIHESELV
jgi:hypothetical protein